MFGTDRLATATSAHHNEGLVPATVQHVSIGNLPTGVDVGWHVLLLTSLEHMDHLFRKKEPINIACISTQSRKLKYILQQNSSSL